MLKPAHAYILYYKFNNSLFCSGLFQMKLNKVAINPIFKRNKKTLIVELKHLKYRSVVILQICETCEQQKQPSRGICKKGIRRNSTKLTGKHLCPSVFLNKGAGLRPKTLAQVFSCEFYEISKNTFFYRIPLVAASGAGILNQFCLSINVVFEKTITQHFLAVLQGK